MVILLENTNLHPIPKRSFRNSLEPRTYLNIYSMLPHQENRILSSRLNTQQAMNHIKLPIQLYQSIAILPNSTMAALKNFFMIRRYLHKMGRMLNLSRRRRLLSSNLDLQVKPPLSSPNRAIQSQGISSPCLYLTSLNFQKRILKEMGTILSIQLKSPLWMPLTPNPSHW